MSSILSFIDTMVQGTPLLQYPTLESLANDGQEALVEGQLAVSSGNSSSESINLLLLCAAQAYLKALDDELHFRALVGDLLPLTSPTPSLNFNIVFEQPAHMTGTTADTSSQSMPAPSFLHHLPNRLIDNLVNIALRVEDWRQGIPREWYHQYRHVNQVGQQRRLHWP